MVSQALRLLTLPARRYMGVESQALLSGRASLPLPWPAHPELWFLSQPSQQRCISANILGRREPALPFDTANLPCRRSFTDFFVYPSPDVDHCVLLLSQCRGLVLSICERTSLETCFRRLATSKHAGTLCTSVETHLDPAISSSPAFFITTAGLLDARLSCFSKLRLLAATSAHASACRHSLARPIVDSNLGILSPQPGYFASPPASHCV